MSAVKRVSLTSVESSHEKVKTKRKGSFRISIPIVEEPASKEYSHFNYESLYKSALDVSKIFIILSKYCHKCTAKIIHYFSLKDIERATKSHY